MNQQPYNPWKAAGVEPVNTRNYYGKIIVECTAMVFPGEKGSGQRPVPYDPQIHIGKQPFTQITITLDPLAEMQLSKITSKSWQNYSPDWTKITMPSIKKLGFVDKDGSCDLEKFNNSFAKFQFVPGFTKNRDPEQPNYKTMEFIQAYKNETECLNAYRLENGQEAETPSHTEPKSLTNDMVVSALKFVESIAENAMKSGHDVAEAVDTFLAQNAAVCAGLKIDSPEIQELLKRYDDNPPF